MRVSLFSWDSNPTVDKAYRRNINHVTELLKTGRASKLTIQDQFGQACYQMCAPVEAIERDQRHLVGGGGYGSAWKIIPSGGMPVWQMPSVRSAVTA